jgi:hypothetical protein
MCALAARRAALAGGAPVGQPDRSAAVRTSLRRWDGRQRAAGVAGAQGGARRGTRAGVRTLLDERGTGMATNAITDPRVGPGPVAWAHPPTRCQRPRRLYRQAKDQLDPTSGRSSRSVGYTANATSTTRRKQAGPLFQSIRIRGSYAEYINDIDYIPEDSEWEAREWDPKYALYCWGRTSHRTLSRTRKTRPRRPGRRGLRCGRS